MRLSESLRRRSRQGARYVALAVLFFSASTAHAGPIEGVWSGVMVREGKRGPVEVTISRQGQTLAATYQGLPSFSGPLLNVQYNPGKQPGTMTFTAVSRESVEGGNRWRLRFYLLHDPSKPQLSGVLRLDADSGQDQSFSVVLEQRPCCHSGCVLREGCPGK